MSDANKSFTSPISGLVRSSARLAGDVLEIAELHLELAKQDSRDALSRSVAPLALIALGASGAIAGLPLLGLAASSALIDQAGWSPCYAYLLSGCGMLLLSILVGFCGAWGLRQSMLTFARSTGELAKNFAWLKSLARETSTQQ
jgi:uncharacterized membrane protein YqjE